MADDPERYSLSPERLQHIYETRIAPDLFRSAQPVERPAAVVLGGQPGAGKTPMQNLASREYADKGGIVKIIGDDLRAHLPHYKALQRSDDKTAAFFTDRDSGRLVEQAIADAAHRRVNVLVEGTMRDPDVVQATLERFRHAGFQTDARALAVSPELSALGILQRYAAQRESRGVGRMTTWEAHEHALKGMLRTLDRIQDQQLADTLAIYRRGGVVIHRYDFTVPAKDDEPRARALVEQERSRPLTPQEADYKRREIERLTPQLQRYGIMPAPNVERENVRPDSVRGRGRDRDDDRDR